MTRQCDFWGKSGIGQLLMVGIEGVDLDNFTIKLIKEFKVSKFIIFSRNTTAGPKKLLNLCRNIKKICSDSGLTSLIAVDQEGGPVRRLRPPLFMDMPTQKEIATSNIPQKKIDKLVKNCSDLLKSLQIDINLAPVLDLPLNGINHVLKDRCMGNTLQDIVTNGSYYIKMMQEKSIKCVAKHFPGIGRVNLDPHLDLPVVFEEKEQILKEMKPFEAAVESGVFGIMTSHVIYEKIDPNIPATFSYLIATELLRNHLSFKGPLFSDDLEMKGILKSASIGEAAIKTLNAGHDILLVCNQRKNILKVLECLKKAYRVGRIKKERIEEAIERQYLSRV